MKHRLATSPWIICRARRGLAPLASLIIALAAPLAGHATESAQQQAVPATPNASPEARALLQLLYDISGKYTLTGQHNNPNTKSHNTDFATSYLGRTPIIFGSDWGHAKAGDTDSYLARPDIVQEAIRQHAAGLDRGPVLACGAAHADEPGHVQTAPGQPTPSALASVQGRLPTSSSRTS